MRILLVVGAATPPGRLTHAVASLADEVAQRNPRTEVGILDLNENRVEMLDGRAPADYGAVTRKAVEAFSAADALVLATPVYRGTIPGALKNLLDHVPAEALRGKPVGIVVMGASLHHYLGAESHLRDILAWFGAIPLPTQVYLVPGDFDEGALTDARARSALEELSRSLADLTERLRGSDLRPLPVALASASQAKSPGALKV